MLQTATVKKAKGKAAKTSILSLLPFTQIIRGKKKGDMWMAN